MLLVLDHNLITFISLGTSTVSGAKQKININMYLKNLLFFFLHIFKIHIVEI